MIKRITIAGLGFVGDAIKVYFEGKDIKPLVYDPPKGHSDTSAVAETDLLIVAVPTPHQEDGGFDLTHVDSVMEHVKPGTTVLIKSTVLPGTTATYQKKFPDVHMLFSPEFLSQRTAVHDFAHPTRQIVGYTDKSKEKAEEVLDLLPHAPYKRIIQAHDAEMIKYMNNVFYVLKVTFANQIYDICEALGVNYDAVAAGAITNEPMMGVNHWDVFHGGYRGYGGKCFPKDIRSLIDLGKDIGIDVSLLEHIEFLNNRRLTDPRPFRTQSQG